MHTRFRRLLPKFRGKFPASIFRVNIWRYRVCLQCEDRQVRLKRRYLSIEVHGVIKKTAALVLLFDLRSHQTNAVSVRIVFKQIFGGLYTT